ncbi:CPBP family intramembrane glutamic endopeptidase [Pseudofulvibacter geojedonensis]|uniref:CPBP family intramembrane glutamic endopeptidase n=1 Tax=Pseudofulvibacter geojedonensis TaxID=1123758 RepID=A0ABW3I2Y1_9FLAO
MYISQAYKGLHDGWRYVLGVLVSFFIGSQIIGALPLFGAIAYKSVKDGKAPNITDLNSIFTMFEPNITLVLILFPFLVGLVLLLIWNKVIHKGTLTWLTTSRSKIDWKRIFFAFGLWGLITVVLTVVGYKMNPSGYVWNFDAQKFAILAIIAIVLVPIQTSFEEYLFRGYLMQGIGLASKNKWLPLVITSVVFGLMHIANPEVEKIGYIIMVYYIGTGFFLGILTLMDEGLELALGFHAANNLITALLVTANWTAFQTNSILKDMSEPAAGIDVLIPVFVVFPILLFIFAKKYKWTNWNEKLFGKIEEPNSLEISDIGVE